ncbi:hypothetical protein Tco_1119700 [Tanacetum coccineum]
MAKLILNEARAEKNLVEPSIKINVKYKLGEELLKELHSNFYSGRVEEDVVGHIAKILEILDLIKVAGMDLFQLRMKTFPLSLSREARKWWMNEGDGKINTWEELVNKSFNKFYPLSCTSNYDKMCDDDEEDRDPLEFITWRNSKFKNHKKVDETTKRALLHSWIEVGNNEGIMDEDLSNNDDRDHTNSSMITKPELKIGDEFLKILHDNSFNGMDGSDVTDHIAKVLEITEWIKIPNVDKDELRLHVFLKSLSGDVEKWWNNKGIATTWKELCDEFLYKYYPLSHTYKTWVKHSNDLLHLRNPTAQDMEILVKTCLMPLALKTQNDSFAFVHELKQEMHADLKYVESLEDELDELESDKAEFSNMYDMLLQECVSKDVMCSYLQSSSDLDEITELQCLYLHKVRECDCLAQKLSEQTEFVSKEIYTELLQSFAKLEKHSISLEIALQECQEQLKNDTVCKEKASNVFRKEREQYFEIQDLKAQLQDKNIAISELKKLIEKCKGKSVDTKFDKPSVVRQPNAQRIPKPSVLGKPTPFSNSLKRTNFAKKKSVLKTSKLKGLTKTSHSTEFVSKATQAVRNTNVIKPDMYRIASSTAQTRVPQLNQTSRNTNPRVSTSTGVAHKTNVSRPQPRSNQMKDKVVPNTSHVKFKKTEVEEHPRISSISNQTKSVTVCNNSLKSRTSNVNAVCATCGKCVFNANHDACVSKFLKVVNARTKKPNGVPISTRKPKSQANKSVATPHKKTVASESTITNSKSYYRMLYKKTNKAWKWWIAQQCPSAYTWVPKTKRKWVPKVRNKSVTKKIVQLILFIVDSGCTKHMTGNLSLLCNFVEKYLGTVRFGNDQFAPILGYGDLVQGNITIKRVYYVEGLNHNLFSVGQFYDADLEKQLHQLQSVSWLKHHQRKRGYGIEDFFYLNFDYINLLSKKDVMIGVVPLN